MGVVKRDGMSVSVKSTEENNCGDRNKTILIDIQESEGASCECCGPSPYGRASIKLPPVNDSDGAVDLSPYERYYTPGWSFGGVDILDSPVLLLDVINLLGYMVNVNLIASGNEEDKEFAELDFNYDFSTFDKSEQLDVMRWKEIKSDSSETQNSSSLEQKLFFTLNVHVTYPDPELNYPYFFVSSLVDTHGKIWQGIGSNNSGGEGSLSAQLSNMKSMTEALNLIIGSILGYNISFNYEHDDTFYDNDYEYDDDDDDDE
jgi:hypothetical protein